MGSWGTCIGGLIDRNHDLISEKEEKFKITHTQHRKELFSLHPSLYTNPRRILRKKKGNFDANAAKARDLHGRLVFSIPLVYFL